jgi:hypothetical protein
MSPSVLTTETLIFSLPDKAFARLISSGYRFAPRSRENALCRQSTKVALVEWTHVRLY